MSGEENDRPKCAVCGAPSTGGVGQTDPSDPRIATLVFMCDEHRAEASGELDDLKRRSGLAVAPHDAQGHASTCDRVRPMTLPAYYRRSDRTCVHCGRVLSWATST